jgi:hypothetical protein
MGVGHLTEHEIYGKFCVQCAERPKQVLAAAGLSKRAIEDAESRIRPQAANTKAARD